MITVMNVFYSFWNQRLLELLLFSHPQLWTNDRIQQISPEKQSNCNYHSFMSRYWCQGAVPRLSFTFLFSPLKMRISFKKHKLVCFAHWGTDWLHFEQNECKVMKGESAETEITTMFLFGFLMFKQTSKRFHRLTFMYIFFNWYDETQHWGT